MTTAQTLHVNGRRAVPGPQVVPEHDNRKTETFAAAALGEGGGEDGTAYLDQASPGVTRIDGLDALDGEARRHLLTTLAQQRGCVVEVAGQRFKDLFEAVVVAIAGPDQPVDQQAATRQAAIEAAGLVHPSVPEVTAERINRRLAELGAPTIDTRRLIGEIRAAATNMRHTADTQQDAPDDAVSARVLADRFLDARRHAVGLGPREPVLRHFRDAWHMWDGSCWRVTSEARLRNLITAFLLDSNQPLTESSITAVRLHLLGRALLDQVDDVDPPFVVVQPSPLRLEHRKMLAVANGMIDLDMLSDRALDRLLEPADPRCFVTSALPVRFEPEATCPRWEALLDQALPRQGDGDLRREVLGEFIAYTLLDDCRHDKMLILIGQGANGKTTVLRVIEALLGSSNVSHVPFEQLGEPFRLHELAGKRANIASEFDEPTRAHEARLKQLISGEPINADRKHRSAEEVRTAAKMLLACNTLPTFTPSDHGVWRRLIILPFHETFHEQRADVRLAQTLIAEELPGIFAWALRAGARLLEQGRFSDCRRCAQALVRHRSEGDPVREFVNEYCELDPKMGIERDALYRSFCHFWRTRLGLAERPPDRATFGKRLRAAFEIADDRARRPLKDGRRPRLYSGIQFSPEGVALYEELDKRQ